VPADPQVALARAERLLTATAHYDELGHHQLAAEARIVAGDVRELVAALEAERGMRRALQARTLEAERILGERAYKALQAAQRG
jgi:hypothetical protein